MTTTIRAIYKNGVFKPTQHVTFPHRQKFYLLAIPEAKWKKEFVKLVKKFQQYSKKFSSKEIEKDITLASQELHRCPAPTDCTIL